MSTARIICPKCGRADAVRKVTAIVDEGTTYTDSNRSAATTRSFILVLDVLFLAQSLHLLLRHRNSQRNHFVEDGLEFPQTSTGILRLQCLA